jgi:hypothetical protein
MRLFFSLEYLEFCVVRDAWLMYEGLNDADPFVGHPPCYAHPRYAHPPYVPEAAVSA